jgi:hypothetical protein
MTAATNSRRNPDVEGRGIPAQTGIDPQSLENRMCNDYRLKVEVAAILEDFADLKITVRFSEGMPNIQARDDIKITDTAPIVRMLAGETHPNRGACRPGRGSHRRDDQGTRIEAGHCTIISMDLPRPRGAATPASARRGNT